jgi:hypothetical protein
MTPNWQSPAYALVAQSWLPCCVANSASASESSALTMEYPAHCINSPAYGSKSEDKITTAQGGGPQILSAFVK